MSQACPVVMTLRPASFQVQSKFIEPVTQATPLLGTGRSRTNKNRILFSSNRSFLVGRKDTAMSTGEEGSDGLGSEGRRDTCDPGRRRGKGRMGLTRTSLGANVVRLQAVGASSNWLLGPLDLIPEWHPSCPLERGHGLTFSKSYPRPGLNHPSRSSGSSGQHNLDAR